MLDIGWSELMVIGVLALIVVGPKELPRLLRTVGQFVGKARSIAREFQRSMEDAAREADMSELTDLKRDVERMGRVDYKDQAKRSSSSLGSGGTKKAAAPGKPAKADTTGTGGETAKPAAAPEPTEPKPSPSGPAAPSSAPEAASGDR